MVRLSCALGVVVEVHTPRVNGGSVGVADEEPATAVETTGVLLVPRASALPPAWQATRQRASTAIARGERAQRRACCAMSPSSRQALVVPHRQPLPDRTAVSHASHLAARPGQPAYARSKYHAVCVWFLTPTDT